MHKRKLILFLFAILMVGYTTGQTVNSLYYMDNLPQASKLNPARMPNCNFYLNLATVNARVFSSFGPGLILNSNNVINDTLRMPYYNENLWNDFLNQLDDPISMRFETEVGYGFGFKAKNGYYHFDMNQRNLFGVSLAKDLLTMNNLGEGVVKDFSTLGFDATSFVQLGAGYAHSINQNLNIGFKLKLLKGLGNISAQINHAELRTSVEEWRFAGDAEMNMSLPISFLLNEEGEIDGIDDSKLEDVEFLDYIKDQARDYARFSTNVGAAIDLGVEYKLLPNLHLSASVIDFGKIWWNKDVTNVVGKTDEDVVFDGISEEPIYSLDDDQSMEDYFTEFGDSLLGLFSQTVSFGEYATTLAPKLYIGAEYLLSETISFGVLSNTTFYKNNTMQSVMFSANANLYRFLTAGAHYGWNWGFANSAGFTLGLDLWPLQIFVAADYLPLKYKNVNVSDGVDLDLGFKTYEYLPVPVDFNALSFQIGVNLKFGCRKKYNIPLHEFEYDDELPGLRR